MKKKTEKAALLIIDMSKDFRGKEYEIAEGVFKKPGLPVPDAEKIIKHIRLISLTARREDIFIAYVMDKHEKNDPEFKEWPPHNIKSFPGSMILDELYVDGARTYGKQVYDGFTNPFLAIDLSQAGVKTVVLVGLVGDICVQLTGEGAKKSGFDVIFVREAICFLPDVENNSKLKEEKFKELEKIGKVVSLAEAMRMLRGGQ